MLATIATAFQVAGVSSMVLAKIILASGIWVFATVEVGFSKWLRKTGRYRHAILLATCCVSGLASVRVGSLIAEMRYQSESAANRLVTPEVLFNFDRERDIINWRKRCPRECDWGVQMRIDTRPKLESANVTFRSASYRKSSEQFIKLRDIRTLMPWYRTPDSYNPVDISDSDFFTVFNSSRDLKQLILVIKEKNVSEFDPLTKGMQKGQYQLEIGVIAKNLPNAVVAILLVTWAGPGHWPDGLDMCIEQVENPGLKPALRFRDPICQAKAQMH